MKKKSYYLIVHLLIVSIATFFGLIDSYAVNEIKTNQIGSTTSFLVGEYIYVSKQFTGTLNNVYSFSTPTLSQKAGDDCIDGFTWRYEETEHRTNKTSTTILSVYRSGSIIVTGTASKRGSAIIAFGCSYAASGGGTINIPKITINVIDNRYTVQLNANGGTCPIATHRVQYDQQFSVFSSLPTPVRDGYIFNGWYTSESGGNLVTDNTFFMERDVVINQSDFTLYAHWTPEVVPVSGVSLSKNALTMTVGDVETLTATVTPSHATDKTVTWTTSTPSIATVNNGTVTAVGVGIATITATAGGKSATCTVTVSSSAGDEFRIGALTVRDNGGKALDAIPQGSFLVTVPVTKTADGGDTLIVLASYSADGRFAGLMYVSVEDVPIGATVRVTLPVDNADGAIARLKAFSIAAFANPTPLGASVTFGAE